MSNLDLQEQEEIAALRAWWQKSGTGLLSVVTAVLVAFAGWNFWQYYQRSQAGQAAALYEQLQQALAEKDTKKVRDAAGTLIADFPRTVYAGLGALVSAKVQYDAGELATAKTQLRWAVDNAKDPELQALARVRLANVLVDEKSYDDALKLLEGLPTGEFANLGASLKGDILALQGKTSEARSAYKSAIDQASAPEAVARRERLQMKLDALGERGS